MSGRRSHRPFQGETSDLAKSSMSVHSRIGENAYSAQQAEERRLRFTDR
jgi:hypothetical protein